MRRAFVVLVGVAFAVACTSEVEAQRRKKGKEPELAICKRGKLLMEDDFSEKDILWKFDANECEYRIVKGVLGTKSRCLGSKTSLSREFSPSSDTIVELKAVLPLNTYLRVVPLSLGQLRAEDSHPQVAAEIAPGQKTFYIVTWSAETGTKKVSLGGFVLLVVPGNRFEGDFLSG